MRKGFVSYARADHAMVARLMQHLRPIEREFGIEFWRDEGIWSGRDWRAEIAEAIDAAEIFIVCMSADYLYSRYIDDIESPAIEYRAVATGALVVPVILRPCAWYGSVGDRTVAPLRGQRLVPVSEWRPQKAGLLAAVSDIRHAIQVHFGLVTEPPPPRVRLNVPSLEQLDRVYGPGKLTSAAIQQGIDSYFAEKKVKSGA